jgi:hypothetical protein
MRLEAARSLAVGGVHPTGTMCGGQITIMMLRWGWNEPWPASMMPCTYIFLHTSSWLPVEATCSSSWRNSYKYY